MRGLGGYDDDVAAEIDGEVAECRTRLTSRCPSADQRSTVRTKKAVSISLESHFCQCCTSYMDTILDTNGVPEKAQNINWRMTDLISISFLVRAS